MHKSRIVLQNQLFKVFIEHLFLRTYSFSYVLLRLREDKGFNASAPLRKAHTQCKEKWSKKKKLQTKKPQKDTKRKIKNKITSFVKFSCFLEVIQLIACMIVLFCLKFGYKSIYFLTGILWERPVMLWRVISCLVAIYGAVKGIANVRSSKKKKWRHGIICCLCHHSVCSGRVDKTGYGQVLLWMRAPGGCCNHSDTHRSGYQPQPDVHKTTSTV